MSRRRKYTTPEEAKAALKEQKKKYVTEKYLDILKERRRQEREAKRMIYAMFKQGELHDYTGNLVTQHTLPLHQNCEA